MNCKSLLFGVLFLFLTLTSVWGGPLAIPLEGSDLEEGSLKNLVQQSIVRNNSGHRQSGWRRYRRPRPRLSHKGPMPF
ncbi:apelin [Latimeria chalumnae]|uniref:apelin n=1 Tax=Latimeria chalumnae TaxID=7897 RepID=UPI0006D92A1C|nr:PREDICTED: apelin [Latimeria chalumnae]|eukprot:XP_014341585.1 PREDICTED: apelin [Latimeria chalumnae]